MIKTVKLPNRNYTYSVFFFGSEEEISAAEEQDGRFRQAIQSIIHDDGFLALHFKTYTESGSVNDYILSRSTRDNVDWQLSHSIDNVPTEHLEYLNENDDVWSYESWPHQTMAALYNELTWLLPQTNAQIEVITAA